MDPIRIDVPEGSVTGPRAPKNSWEAILGDDDGVFEDKVSVILTDRIAEGDICDVYRGNYRGAPSVIKVARQVGDNDLVENEANLLLGIYPKDEANIKFNRYFPKVSQSFIWAPEGKRVNIIPFFEGFNTFEEIIAAYPAGIPFEHVVWMTKRTLAGIGYAHSKGILHGALLPPHVMVHGVEHSAKLIDWSYGVAKFEEGTHRVQARSAAWSAYYAPEILERRRPFAATDIYMVAKCAVALLGGNVVTNEMPNTVPEFLQRFFLRCLRPQVNMRPQNAWDLHEEFDAVLQRDVGKRHYIKFEMP